MSDSGPHISKIVVSTMIRGLEEAKTSMQNMQKEIHTMELSISEIKGVLKSSTADVNALLKIIRDGNGKEPLIDRVAKIENNISSINEFISEQKEVTKEKTKGLWQVKVALATGILGLIGTIVTSILSAV